MRELGRGGALVAAAVAQLENKTNARLCTTRTRTSASESMADKARKVDSTTKNKTGVVAKAKKETYDRSSSSSDNDEYVRKKPSPEKLPVDNRDSVSVKSSERDTSDDLEESEDSSDDTEESEEEDDRTQESVLEKNVVVVKHQDPPITSPDRDTSTPCDEDFQWIKSERDLGVNYEQNDNVVSPAPDTEEEECRKIIKSKRTDIAVSKHPLEKPPVPSHHDKGSIGSLDRRRHHSTNRMERDQKSKSSHNLKGSQFSPSKSYNYYDENYSSHSVPVDFINHRTPDNHMYMPQYGSQTPPRYMNDLQRRALSYEHFNRRHEHNDPNRYGSNSLLLDPRMDFGRDPREYMRNNDSSAHPDMRNVPYYHNSKSDIHGSHGELYYAGSHYPHRPGMDYHCHPSPYWCSCSEQSRYRMQYGCKNSEIIDDRVRRLETDKDSLQLQVSVLSDQIAAQTEKINDLERALNEKRNLLANAEEMLQREMLTRSSLETQKLELMSTVSEARLRQAALERENLELRNAAARPSPGPPSMLPNGAARRHSPSPSPSPASSMLHHNARDNTPRTPPATYRRLVNDQSPHSYSSLPRGASLASTPATPRTTTPLDTAVVLRSVGFADKDTVIGTASSPILGKVPTTGKVWGSLFKGGSGGALEDITDGDMLDPFQRGGVRATAAPRLQSTQGISNQWSSVPIKEWDSDITCEWLETLGLECYNVDAKKWLTNPAGNKGILATATHQQIERELNIKNSLHKKKILLALTDIQGTSQDPLLSSAGRLDSSWALRWLEDAGLPQYREAWAAARADGRVLHRLCNEDLQTLKVTSQLHALSIRRGIQVLRENNFSPDTMIRRGVSTEPGTNGESEPEGGSHVSRWSSHRVMEWLRAVDLAEYAPNLRGAGVHGGLMYYETRFTGELLATLLNIPPSKTLLRRHLNTRFNQLLGKEIIQEKREAEQTLGYQPLTLTSKVKVVKKGQFTLKRKKNKETEYDDLVCPIIDQASGEILSMMKMEVSGGEAAVACKMSDEMSNSTDSPLSQRSDHSHS